MRSTDRSELEIHCCGREYSSDHVWHIIRSARLAYIIGWRPDHHESLRQHLAPAPLELAGLITNKTGV